MAGFSDATWDGDNSASPLHAHSGEGKDIFVLSLDSTGDYRWHTFYGGSDDDKGYAIACDGNGDLYVMGYSDATWDGGNNTLPLETHSSYTDIAVLSLTRDGTYRWHTFYRGASSGYYGGVAFDGSGNLYVVGKSDAPWNGPGNVSPRHAYSNGGDMIVLSLTSDGTYRWHTFYGGSSSDQADAIALDGSDNLYVTGNSYRTWNGDNDASPLHPFSSERCDITVLSLTSAGDYRWHTFYGGSDYNYGFAIACGGNDALYVTGSSKTTWNGDDDTGPLHPYNGAQNISVLSLTTAGAYVWHTFYGESSLTNEGQGIVLDESDNLYVSANCGISWNGDGDVGPLHPYNRNDELTVFSLTGAGAYRWHTFYGSSGEDYGRGIVLDGNGTVYVIGSSDLTWDGDDNASPLHAHSGSGTCIYDITVLALGPSSHTVTPSAGENGSVSPNTAQTVASGTTTGFTVTPNEGYATDSAVGGTCPSGRWDGSVYTTGAITADCTVSFSFSSAANYTVIPSAGTGGSVSPSTAQTVNSGATQAFTVTASSGYTTNSAVGGTCPTGSWNGSVYTTGAITVDCTVSFSFTEIENPSFLLWTK